MSLPMPSIDHRADPGARIVRHKPPRDPDENWMRDLHPSLDAADREERRDGRISDAIGCGALFVAGSLSSA
jgi:hypothetical protein